MHTAAHCIGLLGTEVATLISGKARHCPAEARVSYSVTYISALFKIDLESPSCPPITYTPFPSMLTVAHACLATLMSGKARHCPLAADTSYYSALFK
jgi:hypothetical protein